MALLAEPVTKKGRLFVLVCFEGVFFVCFFS